MSVVTPVRKVSVPMDSGVMFSLNRSDFADAYESPLSLAHIDIGNAYVAIFGFEPAWLRWLMNLRGLIAVRLGVAHPFDAPPMAAGEKPCFQPGMRVRPLTVQSVSTDQIVVGDDDKHLNFRIWS